MNRVLGTLAALVLLVTTLSACTGSNAVDQNANGTFRFAGATKLGELYPESARKTAGPFAGPLLNGGTFASKADAGKVTVINFWASWCGPCQTETPQFDLLYRDIRSRGVGFVGIDTKDDRGNAKAFVANHRISFPVVFDEQGVTALKLGNIPQSSLPFTVVLDKHHKVAAVYIIRLSAADLQAAVDKLLAEH